ncbi:ribonuclease P protein component [Paraliobacillus ryukyuensis]|uniref:Ribonuclease P protein component n=1 Tax=Paraliobacillus ryukyuensis TaxID=200904 RepID=A0A366EC33_9BACI|nr:ribonuclease P protein component [Paraliobacillus ryukyuensis]RBO99936.1 ribonuclease P protein component [Paraliobacillus ryukyuensis]
MKKMYRIKKNEEFQHVFKKGKSFANRQLVIYFVRNNQYNHFRIGLSVSKKIGNAVVRNRIKRYLRQTFLELKEEIDPAFDMVIIARIPTKDMEYHGIKKSLMHVLSKTELLKRYQKTK